MNFSVERLSLVVGSYLLGSIPFGLVIAHFFFHTDVRQQGSGNSGATNVWRVLGWKPGLATLLLDILKGFLPVLMSMKLFPNDLGTSLLCGLAAILGHNWSLFLKGSGGKGVATSVGVFLALMPKQAGLAILTFLIFFLLTHYVSVGSMAASLVLAASCFIFDTPALLKFLVILASTMVLVKHLPNIKRLVKGEEHRVNFR
jgi:glycerol-3-phosphate acyltransferase PlsY